MTTQPSSNLDYTRIRYETTPQSIWITLSRPDELNLVDDTVWAELHDAFIRARFEEDHSVLVLRGSGRLFSGGGDLGADISKQALEGFSKQFALEMYKHVQAEYPVFDAIANCPKTTIAALNGSAYGAAVVMATLCDFIIAVRGAKMSFAPGKWGVADTVDAAWLPRRVGTARAKDLLFTAREIPAEEAERIGLVTRLCDRERFDESIVKFVEEILTTSPTVRALLKDVIHRQLPAFSSAEHYETAVGDDFRAGVQAFMARQPPPWTADGLAERASQGHVNGAPVADTSERTPTHDV